MFSAFSLRRLRDKQSILERFPWLAYRKSRPHQNKYHTQKSSSCADSVDRRMEGSFLPSHHGSTQAMSFPSECLHLCALSFLGTRPIRHRSFSQASQGRRVEGNLPCGLFSSQASIQPTKLHFIFFEKFFIFVMKKMILIYCEKDRASMKNKTESQLSSSPHLRQPLLTFWQVPFQSLFYEYFYIAEVILYKGSCPLT